MDGHCTIQYSHKMAENGKVAARKLRDHANKEKDGDWLRAMNEPATALNARGDEMPDRQPE